MFNLFTKKKQTPSEQKINDDVLAVIYLMIEAANIDEVFEEREKKIIATIIKKQFQIESDSVVEETIEKVNENLRDNADLLLIQKK